MRWTLKTIFYCHIETFAHKPFINSKIENSFCRSKFAIINIWENPKYTMVLAGKKKKLDQSVLSAFCMFLIPWPRSIGRIDPVDPADPRNGTRRSGGSDRIVRHVPKRRSKSIQYGGRLSNVLTTCFYMNYGRCIELCCQNDAICCESDIILLKSTSLLRFPSLFSKY